MADAFRDAARRHRNDAKHLAANGRYQNAGHLIGFAAECLAKEVLQHSGIKITKSDGLMEHFPRLGEQIRRNGKTRAIALLTPIVQQPSFLDGWKAECRYEGDMKPADAQARFNAWLADVDLLFRAAGVP